MINQACTDRIKKLADSQKELSDADKAHIIELCGENPYRLRDYLYTLPVSETFIAKILAEISGYKYLDANELFPYLSALSVLPELAAVRLNVLPLNFDNHVLGIAVSDPLDITVINEIKLVAGELDIYVAPKTRLAETIQLFYNLYSAMPGDELNEVDDPTKNRELKLHDKNHTEKFIDYILHKAVADNASDIHFEPLDDITRVRYRIDGTLFNLVSYDVKLHPQIVSRLKIASAINIAEKRLPQDGRTFYKEGPYVVDIRVSTLPTIYGEKVVLRLLKQDTERFELGRLGFDDKEIDVFKRIIQCNSGLILIAGPTGSGKSTTLHALMKLMNSSNCNVISIEDPVEYTIKGINQVQVNDTINLSFSNILRSVLRQDPDKIMIGEIRDIETAQLAVRAALTGHLVLSTLHTDNTVTAVERLKDMGIQPYLLAASLKCVIAQRLVRKLCNNCKESFPADEQMAKLLNIQAGTILSKSVGCDLCHYSGHYGRTVIAEILTVDNCLREMIISGASTQKMFEYAEKQGMVSLKNTLLMKIARLDVGIDALHMFN